MREDYDVNPYFDRFYAHLSSGQPGVNPYSYLMQREFMNMRFKKEQTEQFVNRLLIQERAMLEQLEVFIKSMRKDGIMGEDQYQDIKREFKEKLAQIHQPECFVFLRSSIDVVMNRILKRNRHGEAENISKDYVMKLEDSYQRLEKKLLQKLGDKYLIIIETDDKTAEEVLSECLNKIQELMDHHFKKAGE